MVNNASLADELRLKELPEHVQSRASLEGEVLEVTPPVHEQDDAEMTVTVLEDTLPVRVRNDASLAGEVLEVTPPVHKQDDAEMTVTVLKDTLPVHVKDSASLVDEILEDVTSDREADEVSPQDEMVKETPVSRAPSVVNKPTLQQEIVDEVAVELGVVPREELEAHRELESITKEASSAPAGPQMSIHDGVDLVITMTEEEASEWLTDSDGVTQHDASGLSEETQMWELMEADRAAEETAEPEAEEPTPREDTELDDEFKRLVDAEAMGEYVTASLRRHARWSAFQQKHNSLVRSYPATGEDTQSPAKHSEAADTTDRALANRDNMSLVGSAIERRKVIQQGHIDPAIVSIESCPGEEEFYGTNAMAAVDEWRRLHRQSIGMQSKLNFDNESSEYLLCRDKILAVEVYLIGEHALTIKRPQAPDLNDRTSIIPRYKEASEYEQKQAAIGLLKNIALVPVRAPGWGWKWVSKKVTDKRQSALSGAQNRNNQI